MSGIVEMLRAMRVAVVHPPDQERDALVGQLRRIGCEVHIVWPAPREAPMGADAVFVVLDQTSAPARAWAVAEGGPTVIAVVEYENPLMLKALLDSAAHGVLVKPLRPFGILSMLVLARSQHGYNRRMETKIRKLEETLKAHRDVAKAARILANLKSVPESQAYELIRAQATRRRVAMAQVAAAIIGAQDMLKDLSID